MKSFKWSLGSVAQLVMKAAWISVVGGAFAVSFDGGDTAVVAGLLYLLLTIPVGYVLHLSNPLNVVPRADWVGVAEWVVGSGLAYVQWFIALPWVVRRFRRHWLGLKEGPDRS